MLILLTPKTKEKLRMSTEKHIFETSEVSVSSKGYVDLL